MTDVNSIMTLRGFESNSGGSWQWGDPARRLLDKYPQRCKCYACKHGIARVTTGTTDAGRQTIHLRTYCDLMSMDVYDNASDELGELIEMCDGYDDTPDDD